jgi:hypothetical protein
VPAGTIVDLTAEKIATPVGEFRISASVNFAEVFDQFWPRRFVNIWSLALIQRLQKRCDHVGVFKEPINCLKAHAIAVKQDRDIQIPRR